MEESPALEVFQSGMKILAPTPKHGMNIGDIFKEASDSKPNKLSNVSEETPNSTSVPSPLKITN